MAEEVRWRIRLVDMTRGTVRSVQRGMDAIGRAAKRAARVAFNAFRGFGNFVLRQTRRAALGLAAIGIASVKMAADAEEAASKFEVVFGGAAEFVTGEMEKFAAATNRSSDELRFLASDAGDVIKALGLEEQQAAELAVTLTKLAVDTASFKNANTPDVIRAFTSALTGERESLKTLGVVINEAQVAQEALDAGIVKNKKNIDTQAKALATVGLLQRRLSDAQGDAARTADSLTNESRGFLSVLRDSGREIGNQLKEGFSLARMFGMMSRRMREWTSAIKDSGIIQRWAERTRNAIEKVIPVVTDLWDRISAGGEMRAEAFGQIETALRGAITRGVDALATAIREKAPQIIDTLAPIVAAAMREGVKLGLKELPKIRGAATEVGLQAIEKRSPRAGRVARAVSGVATFQQDVVAGAAGSRGARARVMSRVLGEERMRALLAANPRSRMATFLRGQPQPVIIANPQDVKDEVKL